MLNILNKHGEIWGTASADGERASLNQYNVRNIIILGQLCGVLALQRNNATE